jgi:hypothetical protein
MYVIRIRLNNDYLYYCRGGFTPHAITAFMTRDQAEDVIISAKEKDILCTVTNYIFLRHSLKETPLFNNGFRSCNHCGLLIGGDTIFKRKVVRVKYPLNMKGVGFCIGNVNYTLCPVCHEQETGKKCKEKFSDEFIKEWILNKLKRETLCG